MEKELFVKSKAGFKVGQTKLGIAFVKRICITICICICITRSGNIYCLLKIFSKLKSLSE